MQLESKSDMGKLFYTYSLVKSLYEHGRDYIDSFWPFVLMCLARDKSNSEFFAIQARLKQNFGLDIPQYSLTTIVTRAKRKGYVVQEKRRCRLTNEGIRYLDRLESEREVERRINELLEDIRNYLDQQHQLFLTPSEIYEALLSLIYKNIDSIIEYFNPESTVIKLDIPMKRRRKYQIELVHYFEEAEKRKPEIYRTLQDIVYGSVISTIASSPNIAETTKKFRDTQVFLDSNFVFSVLDLHFPEFSKPAQELFDLLKSHKFKIKVFDFTIDEIVDVLRKYSKEKHLYARGVRVGSIYSNLKNQGWSVQDAMEFIAKIEDKIWKLGVDIEPTKVDLLNYNPEKEEYRDLLSKHKPSQSEQSQNHDLAAIEEIKEIRGSPKREIENSKAFFLTCDLRLSRYDFLEMGHKEKVTICEVIPDRLLTNILWLKNPTITKEIPLKTIIAVHSRDMFIDRNIWRQFYYNIKKLKEEGGVNDKDISMLFYNDHIGKVLLQFEERDVDKITTEFILEEVKKVNQKIDDETKKMIERELQKERKIFEEKLIYKESEEEDKWQGRVKKIKGKIEESAKKRAKIFVSIGTWIVFFILAFVLFMLTPTVIKNWGIIEPLSYISYILAIFISFGLSFLGIKIPFKKIKNNLETRLFNKIYKKKLAELKVEELTRR